MVKKATRRKRKKSSLSSSEEDEKASTEQDAAGNHHGAKRKPGVKTLESRAETHSCAFSPLFKDALQSSYQLKKQRRVAQEKDALTGKPVPGPLHGGKGRAVSRSRTVELGPSKPVHHSETSKGRSDGKSPSKSKEALHVPCRAQEKDMSPAGGDSHNSKTQERARTSPVPEDAARQEKRRKLVEEEKRKKLMKRTKLVEEEKLMKRKKLVEEEKLMEEEKRRKKLMKRRKLVEEEKRKLVEEEKLMEEKRRKKLMKRKKLVEEEKLMEEEKRRKKLVEEEKRKLVHENKLMEKKRLVEENKLLEEKMRKLEEEKRKDMVEEKRRKLVEEKKRRKVVEEKRRKLEEEKRKLVEEKGQDQQNERRRNQFPWDQAPASTSALCSDALKTQKTHESSPHISLLSPNIPRPKAEGQRSSDRSGAAPAPEPSTSGGSTSEPSTSEPSTSGGSTSGGSTSGCEQQAVHQAPGSSSRRLLVQTKPWNDEKQVVEELHLARSQNRLELDITSSYGELTCMDIDPPAEGAAEPHFQPKQDLILVLDTNILLSHLEYVKKVVSRGLGVLGFPLVLIPWVVLQEMDSLKRGRGLSGSVAHLAAPAISYVYSCLKSCQPQLWGQSMQQAAASSGGLSAESNDDRVLHCCLQYQRLYPGCALILCTNDKNLCSKALLSGVHAFSKSDLEAQETQEVQEVLEVLEGRGRSGAGPLENRVLPPLRPQVPSEQLHQQSSGLLCVGPRTQDQDQDQVRPVCLSECVSELEDCLRRLLSDVLELEMKAVYEELWLEVVYLKPPWTLLDLLHCLKKHWIAVFGHVVPRSKLQTVLNLLTFFTSGAAVDRSGTLAALQEAQDLIRAFGERSSRVPGALSSLDNICMKLRPQGPSSACDVIMKDDGDDDPVAHLQLPHHEVWALFENIWSNVFQLSLELFRVLGFDPVSAPPGPAAPGPAPPAPAAPPPQDALLFLSRLSSMVSQLLGAFSRVLSQTGPEEAQNLLLVLRSNQVSQ
ncbi:uncharacterized protein V6R79_016383 [Siganus canaliculatus]